ncbi:hypothetical protein [Stappia sp.]|uniref:hypothetical protein n=1 Tax=Stappia sp. TaxID=1870903 RepID=UPI0032D91FA4
MPDRQHLTSKIRSYLDALSPRAVQTLVRGLENARAKGSDDPHLDLILDACLGAVRKPRAIEPTDWEPRAHFLKRVFFHPLEDFLLDEPLPGKVRGRITRSSLDSIWTWLSRDVAPEAVASTEERAARLETTSPEILALADALRDALLPHMRDLYADAQGDDRRHQKLMMLVGGERAFRDLEDIIAVFSARGWLDGLRESLPTRMSEWDFKPGSPTLKRIKAVSDRQGEQAFLVASVVLARLDAPEALMALSAGLAGSDSVRKMAASPYAVFAEMAFSEAERLSGLVCGSCTNAELSEHLNHYIRLVKFIDRRFELDEWPAWQKQVAATRRSISQLVTRDLEAAAGNLRRALLVPKIGADGEPKVDALALEEALRGLMLLDRMRDAADSLAVNEVTARTRQVIDQSLEFKTRALLGDLAKTSGAARTAQLVAVDAGIALCERYYGKDYADQLRRSRKAALSAPAPDADGDQTARRAGG